MSFSKVKKRSIELHGCETSISLENEFWNELKRIANDRAVTLIKLLSTIEREADSDNLSSECRLFVLRELKG